MVMLAQLGSAGGGEKKDSAWVRAGAVQAERHRGD